jgi:hypothetical protein
MQPTPPPENTPGQPTPPPPPPPGGAPGPGGPQQPSNGLGLASMIVGIISIPMAICFCIVGIIGGAVAMVLGFLGKGKAERGEATNRGHAMAGIITGAVAIGLGLLWVLLTVVLGVIDWGLTPDF